jgi:hypothetical protein
MDVNRDSNPEAVKTVCTFTFSLTDHYQRSGNLFYYDRWYVSIYKQNVTVENMAKDAKRIVGIV